MTHREPHSATRAMSLRALLTGAAFFVAATHSLTAQAKPLPVDSGPKLPTAPLRATPPRAGVRTPDRTDGFRSRVLPPPDSGAQNAEAVRPKTAVAAPALDARTVPVLQTPETPSTTRAVMVTRALQEEAQPANATGRCKDGTWLFAPPTQASCAEHGGSAVVFPVRTTPPPPPRRP